LHKKKKGANNSF